MKQDLSNLLKYKINQYYLCNYKPTEKSRAAQITDQIFRAAVLWFFAALILAVLLRNVILATVLAAGVCWLLLKAAGRGKKRRAAEMRHFLQYQQAGEKFLSASADAVHLTAALAEVLKNQSLYHNLQTANDSATFQITGEYKQNKFAAKVLSKASAKQLASEGLQTADNGKCAAERQQTTEQGRNSEITVREYRKIVSDLKKAGINMAFLVTDQKFSRQVTEINQRQNSRRKGTIKIKLLDKQSLTMLLLKYCPQWLLQETQKQHKSSTANCNINKAASVAGTIPDEDDTENSADDDKLSLGYLLDRILAKEKCPAYLKTGTFLLLFAMLFDNIYLKAACLAAAIINYLLACKIIVTIISKPDDIIF